MSDGAATLARAVRLRVLAHYGGQLMLVSAVIYAVPCVVAMLFAEFPLAGILALFALALAGSGWWLSSFHAEPELQRNEALVLVASTFVLTPLPMSIAFMAQGVPWQDALFEAVSGITTTGLSTLADIGSRSPAFLFSRSWLQWCGGLGVIVLTIALIGGQGLASRRLYAPVEEQPLPLTTRHFARRISAVYLGLTLIAALVLALASGSPFTGLLHSLSSVSTGGFSPLERSLADLPDWTSRYLVIIFGFVGALPLAVLMEKRFGGSGRDVEVKTLVVLCIALTLVLASLMHRSLGLTWSEALLEGGLLGISAQSTTGFSVLLPAALDDGAKLVLCVSMLIGGSLGSTAGGMKLLRLLILYRVLQVYFMRTAVPERAVLKPRLGAVALSTEDIRQALILMTLFTLSLIASWLAFLAYGYPAMDSLFEVSSALATTGLSTGISDESLPTTLKLVLCLDMLLGRLEVFALLVLLYPRTWHERRPLRR